MRDCSNRYRQRIKDYFLQIRKKIAQLFTCLSSFPLNSFSILSFQLPQYFLSTIAGILKIGGRSKLYDRGSNSGQEKQPNCQNTLINFSIVLHTYTFIHVFFVHNYRKVMFLSIWNIWVTR